MLASLMLVYKVELYLDFDCLVLKVKFKDFLE